MTKTPKVGISVILINENQEILVGKRKGSHGAGLYSVPGGHVDHGENVLKACYRELEEEIGVSEKQLDGIFMYFAEFSEDFFPEDKHYITLYYYMVVEDGLPVKNCEPEKCEGWEWIHWTELPDEMFCDTSNVIKHIMTF